MKIFYKSKLFWTNLSVFILALGSMFTSEATIETVLPKLIVALLGILGIIFRWDTNQPLGFKQ